LILLCVASIRNAGVVGSNPIGGTIFFFISIDEAVRCHLTGGARVVSERFFPSRTKIIATINAGALDGHLARMGLSRPIVKAQK
jgi:hypothetical protein